MTKNTRRLVALASVSAMSFPLASLRASDVSWSGLSLSTTNWSDTANWQGGVVPVSGDRVIFDAGAGSNGSTVDVGGLVLDSLAFGSAIPSAFTLGGASQVMVGTNGLSSLATAQVTLSLPLALAGAQAWQIGAGATLAQGGDVSGNDPLTKTGPGTLVLSGNNSGLYGQVNVAEGTLAVNANPASSSYAVRMGGGTTAATLLMGTAFTLSNPITVLPSTGRVTLGSTLTSATVLTATPWFTGAAELGAITLQNDVTLTSAGGTQVTGNTTIGGIAKVASMSGTSNVTIDAATNGIVWLASNAARWAGTNTTLTLKQGILLLAATNPTSSLVLSGGVISSDGAGSIVIPASSSVLINGDVQFSIVSNKTFTFSGPVTIDKGTNATQTLRSGADNGRITVFAGQVTLKNDLVLANGLNVRTSSVIGGFAFNAGIKMTASQSLLFYTTGTGNVVKGAFDAAGTTLTLAGTTSLAVQGMSGTVPAFRVSGPTATFDTASNTFSSGVSLTSGTLKITTSSVGSSGAVSNGPIGTGKLTLLGGTVTTGSSGPYTLHNDIDITGGAVTVQDTNGQPYTLAGVTTIAGSPTLTQNIFWGGPWSMAQVNLNSDVTLAGNTDSLRFSSLNLTGDRTIRVTGAAKSLQGDVSGTGGIVVATGTLALSGTGARTFSGSTVVMPGAVLSLSGSDNRMSSFSPLTVDGELDVWGRGVAPGALQTVANLSGSGVITNLNSGGNFSDNVSKLTVYQAGDTTFSGSILWSNGLALVKSGTGRLALTGTNSYSLGTVVTAGTLSVPGSANLPASGAFTLDGGTLEVTSSGTFSKSIGANWGWLSVPHGVSVAFTGGIASNSLHTKMTKTGLGELNIVGNKDFTGNWEILQGSLLVNGTLGLGATAMTALVGDTATLGGGGTLAGHVTVAAGGRLSPGNAGIGTLSATALTLSSYSSLDWEVGATADRLNVTGTDLFTIDGGTLYFTAASGLATGTYTLVDYAGTLQGAGFGGLSGTSGTLGDFNYRVYDDAGTTALMMEVIPAVIPDPAWQGADSSWNTPGNWVNGSVPNGAGQLAIFNGSGVQSVTVDTPVTLGDLQLVSATSYTISGTNTITFSAGTNAAAAMVVSSNTHEVSAPVAFETNATITGAENLRLGAATIAAGARVTLATSGGVLAKALVTKGVTLAGATDAWTSALDLMDNKLVIDYSGSTSPLEDVKNQAISGWTADRNWTGPGLTTSATITSGLQMIGFAEASDVLGIGPTDTAPWSGGGDVDVNGTSVLVKFTYAGDADLNGSVDLDDLFRLIDGFNGAVDPVTWSCGDFDYNGSVDLDDLFMLIDGFNASSVDGPLSPVAVPEPGMLSLAAAGLLLARRRRRA